MEYEPLQEHEKNANLSNQKEIEIQKIWKENEKKFEKITCTKAILETK